MFKNNDLFILSLNDASTTTALTTKEALENTSTFKILATWWDTTIAMSILVASALMAIFSSLIMYFFKNHYKQLNEKFPFLRPAISCICVIAATAVGWLIEMFGRNDNIQLTYFSISIQPLVGRWAFESIIHSWNEASKGLIYICSMHVLGIIIGMTIAQLIVLKASKMGKNKEYNVRTTFGYVPAKTYPHLYKSALIWLFTGATIPFTGYLIYVRSNGAATFTSFTSIIITLSIVFIMMCFTHRVGYYDGNLIFSLWLSFTNVVILKNGPKKQFLINSSISASFALFYPFIWGLIYGAVFLS